MRRFLTVCLFLTAAFSVTFGASAMENKVMALVNKAIDFYVANGQEKAFEEINNSKGQFVQGNLYIFVIDLEGMMLAHGNNPALIGKSMLELKDSNGVYFTREMIKIVKDKGEGWVKYKYTNPATKKVGNKVSFQKKIPNKEIFIGCGYYKD